jgi:hypothetical protein
MMIATGALQALARPGERAGVMHLDRFMIG